MTTECRAANNKTLHTSRKRIFFECLPAFVLPCRRNCGKAFFHTFSTCPPTWTNKPLQGTETWAVSKYKKKSRFSSNKYFIWTASKKRTFLDDGTAFQRFPPKRQWAWCCPVSFSDLMRSCTCVRHWPEIFSHFLEQIFKFERQADVGPTIYSFACVIHSFWRKIRLYSVCITFIHIYLCIPQNKVKTFYEKKKNRGTHQGNAISWNVIRDGLQR